MWTKPSVPSTSAAERATRARAPRLLRCSVQLLCALALLLASACLTPKPQPSPGVTYPDYKVGAPDTLVITILPGATAERVETLVTKKIETELRLLMRGSSSRGKLK